jgi:hypothetical protein
MPKVIVYLRDRELEALHQLARREYRAPKAQAALIIRTELERTGMLTPTLQDELNPNSLTAALPQQITQGSTS